MKIKLKNLGIIKESEFSLGDMTIICGKNNTGKTYITHAVYGFFYYILSNASFKVDDKIVDTLIKNNFVSIKLDSYFQKLQENINDVSKNYSQTLRSVFAGDEKLFKNAEFYCSLLTKKDFSPHYVGPTGLHVSNIVIDVNLSEDNLCLEVHLSFKNDENKEFPRTIVSNFVGEAIAKSLLWQIVPRSFIASAERTGAAMFQKELDFNKNRILEIIGDKYTDIPSLKLMSSFNKEYPLTIKNNVDFIREIPNLAISKSYIQKEHAYILENFKDLLGGEFTASNEGVIRFAPSPNPQQSLSLNESSSSVRSLLDIAFYLKHIAQKGDLLIIDEPELNLHPENQRKMARLLAQLVNAGVKIFITTHSDFLIKELSFLILLNQDKPHLKPLMEKEGYKAEELLSAEKIKIYIAKHSDDTNSQSLSPAYISQEAGIEIPSFDDTISKINEIESEILWGDS